MLVDSTGLSISKKTGAKELYVATSRECSYQRNGKKVRGENLLENCTVHGFLRKMRKRGLCVCRRIERDKIRSLFNKNEKKKEQERPRLERKKGKRREWRV